MSPTPLISISGIVTDTAMTSSSQSVWYFDWNVPSEVDLDIVSVTVSATDLAGNPAVSLITNGLKLNLDSNNQHLNTTDRWFDLSGNGHDLIFTGTKPTFKTSDGKKY